MKQSLGLVNPELPSHVCKLCKSIYGLKQAPRVWFAKLSDYLLSLGFKFFVSDPSLFILQNTSIRLNIFVYIYDIIVIGTSSKFIYDLIKNLSAYFLVKDLGSLHFFLGIEVTHTT